MKNPIQLASLLGLALSLIFTSCANDSSTTTDATEVVQTIKSAGTEIKALMLKNTIPLDTFNTWVANWDSLGRSWMDTAVITAYNMPLVDLAEVYEESGAASSRFYLGLKAKNQGGGYKAKLMVVGVDSSNHDMTTHIFDVSKPCPTHCKSAQ